MLPVVPWSVWEIIKWMDIPTLGKNVVVVGRSKNVGMPIAVPIQIDGACEYPGGDATITIFISTLPKSKWRDIQFLQTFWSLMQAFPIIADMINEGIALINMKIKRVQDPIMPKATLVAFWRNQKKSCLQHSSPQGYWSHDNDDVNKEYHYFSKNVLRLKE